MRHIKGEDRNQKSLLPESLDDYVSLDNPIRVIDAYIDSLDVAGLGFEKAITRQTGRKPYDPRDLLKLYVYGYLNRVTSSRRLEIECHRNLEVLWLMKRLAPDFKTIADFRRNNGEAIRSTCCSFIGFCRKAKLLSGQVVAIDGSKFKGAGSIDRMLTRTQLQRDRKKAEEKIDYYLTQLEEADGEERDVELSCDRVIEAVTGLHEKLVSFDLRESEMDALGTNQHSASESEARLQRSGREGMIAGYNVQTAVEEETGLIVHYDVTDHAGDSRQLLPMAINAKQQLGVNRLDVLADAGYSNGEQQHDCESLGITASVPRRVVPNSNVELYQKADFQYDREKNEYRCSAGKVLAYSGDDKRRKLHNYSRRGCNTCDLHSKCAKSDKRVVTRNFFEDAFERSEQRLQADPNLMTRRMAIVERPFAVLKSAMAMRRFVCWGLRGAKTETGIGVLTYSIKTMTNRLGVRTMLSLVS